MTDLLRDALDHTEAIVQGVPDERRGGPTGCPDWDVTALINHMVGGNRYFAASARGETADRAMFEHDHLGDDPVAAYRASAEEAVEAWSRPGVLEQTLASGMPAQFLWGIHLIEALGHGWDLANATGQSRDIPEHLAQAGLGVARQMPAERVRRPGVFGPEVEPAAGASPADQLAAFLGRHPTT